MTWVTEFTTTFNHKRIEYQTNVLANHSRAERPDRVLVSGKVVHKGYASDGKGFETYRQLSTCECNGMEFISNRWVFTGRCMHRKGA